jgi:hypothetical protein
LGKPLEYIEITVVNDVTTDTTAVATAYQRLMEDSASMPLPSLITL